ncbi:MAG: hypothetical protein AAF950_05865 [Pseudomonadota bacterium]
MKLIHLLSITAVSTMAIPAAQADDADWYSTNAGVSVSQVDTYLADQVPNTEDALQVLRPTAQDWSAIGKTIGNNPLSSDESKAKNYFDGYTPNAFKGADAKLGTPRHFFKINEYASIAPIYDETARHGAVEGGNLFAKAEIDWREIF